MRSRPSTNAAPSEDPAQPACVAAGMGQCSLDVLFTVDAFPPPDAKIEFRDRAVQGGGPVATALVALARWGVGSRFAGVVGGDRFGARILAGLKREGIDTSANLVREHGTSQLAYICVERPTGRRTIFWCRPGGPPLGPDEIPAGFLRDQRVLHLDGSFHQTAGLLARQARALGIPVVLDAGSRKPGTEELIRHTDHLIASETFAGQMAPGRPLAEQLRFLRSMGPAWVTITLGCRGSVSLWDAQPAYLPALPVRVVDTTGAGDVFHGAYLYGLLQGWPPERRLRWSTVAAALSCQALGGRAGIPSREQIRARLRRLSPFSSAIPEPRDDLAS